MVGRYVNRFLTNFKEEAVANLLEERPYNRMQLQGDRQLSNSLKKRYLGKDLTL
jgi:hypothetical protein